MAISLYFKSKGFTLTCPLANSNLVFRSFKSSLLKSIKLNEFSSLLKRPLSFSDRFVVNNSASALPETVLKFGAKSLSKLPDTHLK